MFNSTEVLKRQQYSQQNLVFLGLSSIIVVQHKQYYPYLNCRFESKSNVLIQASLSSKKCIEDKDQKDKNYISICNIKQNYDVQYSEPQIDNNNYIHYAISIIALVITLFCLFMFTLYQIQKLKNKNYKLQQDLYIKEQIYEKLNSETQNMKMSGVIKSFQPKSQDPFINQNFLNSKRNISPSSEEQDLDISQIECQHKIQSDKLIDLATSQKSKSIRSKNKHNTQKLMGEIEYNMTLLNSEDSPEVLRRDTEEMDFSIIEKEQNKQSNQIQLIQKKSSLFKKALIQNAQESQNIQNNEKIQINILQPNQYHSDESPNKSQMNIDTIQKSIYTNRSPSPNLSTGKQNQEKQDLISPTKTNLINNLQKQKPPRIVKMRT